MSSQLQSTRIPLVQSLHAYMGRELTGIISLIAVSAFDIGSSSPDPRQRIPLIALHILFFAGFIGFDFLNWWRPISGHLALTIFVILQLLLIYYGSSPTAQIMLLFVLSAYAQESLPEFHANLWILSFGVASMIGFGLIMHPPIMGILTGFGTLGGYIFIGNAARNRRVAEAARAESQRLLHELQAAHDQLQRYAHEAEVLAATEERNRVARELHDTLGHRLTVAAVQLEGAQRLIRRDAEKATHMVEVVRGQVLDALTELRQTVATLHTPIEADLALPAAITLLANQYAAATGLQVHLHIDEQILPTLDKLPQAARHTLYRATQEGLTNVHKHAHATAAWIQLEHLPEQSIRLTIHDNGQGIHQANPGKGYGLAGLAERAAQSHGRVRLDASPYGGSALRLTLPLAQSTAPHTTEPHITEPHTTEPKP